MGGDMGGKFETDEEDEGGRQRWTYGYGWKGGKEEDNRMRGGILRPGRGGILRPGLRTEVEIKEG